MKMLPLLLEHYNHHLSTQQSSVWLDMIQPTVCTVEKVHRSLAARYKLAMIVYGQLHARSSAVQRTTLLWAPGPEY